MTLPLAALFVASKLLPLWPGCEHATQRAEEPKPDGPLVRHGTTMTILELHQTSDTATKEKTIT